MLFQGSDLDNATVDARCQDALEWARARRLYRKGKRKRSRKLGQLIHRISYQLGGFFIHIGQRLQKQGPAETIPIEGARFHFRISI
jgi:hypothetical protein